MKTIVVKLLNLRQLLAGLLLLEAVLIGAGAAGSAYHYIKVKAKKKYYHQDGTRCYSDWIEYDTRTVDGLEGFLPDNEPAHNRNGARMDRKVPGAGFYRVVYNTGRWWLADPDGYLTIHRAIVTLKPGTSKNQQAKVRQLFGTPENWLNATTQLLNKAGFNGAGNWSDADLLNSTGAAFAYTRGFNFMSAYGKKRGGTFQQPGHTGYPDDLIFVFDPEFEKFCDKEAAKAAAYANEKNLVGYFSDNEMPFPADALDRCLKKNKKDYSYQAASSWLAVHKGEGAVSADITDTDREAFLYTLAERYFSVVAAALKKYDPNHLYLGSRFHAGVLDRKPVFQAAGKYVDVISVNYYDVWTPDVEQMKRWSSWSGKPVIITEWYTKAEDSGMKNVSGAGWIVPTQRDRGFFYQNFALALIESDVCVGWHWFKYQDNDPDDKNTDPSNEDSNKGIVNNDFIPYTPLLEEMTKLNTRVYSLADFFDQSEIGKGN